MSSYTQLSHKCFELVANSNLSNKLWISFPLSLSQIVTVVFYIFTDLILISQFLYYKIKNSSSRSKPWFISSLEFKWKTVEWRLWCVSHNYSMILHMNENLKLWGRRYFLLLTQWLCSCLHCQFFVLCVCPLESPVLKWLCFMWCGAATLVLLALPKLIIDNSTTLDTQVGRVCVYVGHIFQCSEIKCSVFSSYFHFW